MFVLDGSGSVLPILLHSSRLAGLVVMGVAIVMVRSGVFSSSSFKMQSRGLDLLLAGKPVEAEKCYRKALDQGAKVPDSDRVRLLVCLGDALMDQGRYEDARQTLTQALGLGDPTGSGQGSMCDVLLAQKVSPEEAMEMADEAMRLRGQAGIGQSFGTRWAAVSKDLYEATTWARKARALLMLDRREDARNALENALRILEAAKPELEQVQPETSLTGRLILGNRLQRMKDLTISDASWQIGLALLAMGDKQKSTKEFLVVCKSDPLGKYRNLAQRELDQLGYSGATSR